MSNHQLIYIYSADRERALEWCRYNYRSYLEDAVWIREHNALQELDEHVVYVRYGCYWRHPDARAIEIELTNLGATELTYNSKGITWCVGPLAFGVGDLASTRSK